MHRAFCSFNDDEYEALEAKAKKLGMSTSKLIEYATTLFLDMPRSETPNVKEIRKKIEKYLEKVKDETFICSKDDYRYINGLVEHINSGTRNNRYGCH